MGSREARCAVYTRKSTEEGLDQAFNSLDAQRDACAAYIASQKHEGWTLVPGVYDDGGFSGGSMERPGLKRLLADVEAGRVDVIVVYKVDRLTRSLADFAKIVEVLDAYGASFVSVTQAFNTTTSMGRLTLNVLLSFAQFEREVTGERIRDKIAASKKKGMWMGGPVPLGYDVRDRKLVVNEAEAETVRLIFKRHQAVGTIQALVADLTVRRIISKRRTLRDGRETGGEPYRAGALTHLLRNVLYTGQVSHHGTIYAGEHDAIVDRETWEASQALLDRSEPRPRTGHIAMLGGMIEDGHGRRMTSAHAKKGRRRYLYYVSVPDTDRAEREWRLPAGDVDTLVRNAVLGLLRDPLRLAGEYGDVSAHARLAPACAGWVDRLQQPAAMRAALQQLDAQVIVGANRIDVGLSARELATLLHVDGLSTSRDQRIECGEETSLKRRGHELRLVYAAPDANPPARDDRLIQLIASGHAAYEQLLAGEGKPGTAKRSHLVRLARLRFLAPDIVTAIVHGRQPVDLTSRALLRAAELPLAWVDQRKVLGFASAHRN
ncbi:recombinase family protein [Sphingomonas sp. IW22]|uniref:recombinase family protein n=1 Tax=Sphingomonas sp. IW22 TaxID=3242489 RepID=UPI003520F1DC